MTQKKQKLFWVEKSKKRWSVILEINASEIYRISITPHKYLGITFHYYVFERFDSKNKTWTLEQSDSKYTVTTFLSIERIYLNHIFNEQVKNLCIVIKKDSDQSEKKHRIYKRLFSTLEKHDFQCVSSDQKDCYVLIAYTSDRLKKMKDPEDFINKRLSKFVFLDREI